MKNHLVAAVDPNDQTGKEHAFRGSVSLKSFFYPPEDSGRSDGPQIGMSFNGTIEFLLGPQRWQCRYHEASVTHRRGRRDSMDGASPTPLAGAPTAGLHVFWSGNGLIQSCAVTDGATHLAVDAGSVPPSHCSSIPEIILGSLDARANADSEMLLDTGILSEIPRSQLSQTVNFTQRSGKVHSWVINVLVPSALLMRSPDSFEKARLHGTRVVWAMVHCSAGLCDDRIESLEVHMTRYLRGSRYQNRPDQRSIVCNLQLTRDRSGSQRYLPPPLEGPVLVSDYRFKAKGNGVSPVAYHSVDGVLLTESSSEVATRLAELRGA